jgi:hypothetical protein
MFAHPIQQQKKQDFQLQPLQKLYLFYFKIQSPRKKKRCMFFFLLSLISHANQSNIKERAKLSMNKLVII